MNLPCGLLKKAVFCLLLLSLTACGGLVRQSDLFILQQDSIRMKRDIKDLKQEVAGLKGNVPEEESFNALRESQTSLFSQVSELLREVQVLSGRFDENKYFIDRYLKETSLEMEAVKSRLKDAAPVDKATIAALKTRIREIDAEIKKLDERLTALGPATGAVPKKAAEKATPEQVYETALNAFKEKKYPEARQEMASFLKQYPGHKLSGNAQFWIGESYYHEEDFDDAILAYEEVLQQYKDSPKVPAAMLKQAYAFLEMKDKKAARGILKELIERYPKSEQATTAGEKLETVK